jgi:hypothetical protein
MAKNVTRTTYPPFRFVRLASLATESQSVHSTVEQDLCTAAVLLKVRFIKA